MGKGETVHPDFGEMVRHCDEGSNLNNEQRKIASFLAMTFCF